VVSKTSRVLKRYRRHTFGQCASQTFTEELVSRVVAEVESNVVCRVHVAVRDPVVMRMTELRGYRSSESDKNQDQLVDCSSCTRLVMQRTSAFQLEPELSRGAPLTVDGRDIMSK
jgi:hypothetical protein